MSESFARLSFFSTESILIEPVLVKTLKFLSPLAAILLSTVSVEGSVPIDRLQTVVDGLSDAMTSPEIAALVDNATSAAVIQTISGHNDWSNIDIQTAEQKANQWLDEYLAFPEREEGVREQNARGLQAYHTRLATLERALREARTYPLELKTLNSPSLEGSRLYYRRSFDVKMRFPTRSDLKLQIDLEKQNLRRAVARINQSRIKQAILHGKIRRLLAAVELTSLTATAEERERLLEKKSRTPDDELALLLFRLQDLKTQGLLNDAELKPADAYLQLIENYFNWRAVHRRGTRETFIAYSKILIQRLYLPQIWHVINWPRRHVIPTLLLINGVVVMPSAVITTYVTLRDNAANAAKQAAAAAEAATLYAWKQGLTPEELKEIDAHEKLVWWWDALGGSIVKELNPFMARFEDEYARPFKADASFRVFTQYLAGERPSLEMDPDPASPWNFIEVNDASVRLNAGHFSEAQEMWEALNVFWYGKKAPKIKGYEGRDIPGLKVKLEPRYEDARRLKRVLEEAAKAGSLDAILENAGKPKEGPPEAPKAPETGEPIGRVQPLPCGMVLSFLPRT